MDESPSNPIAPTEPKAVASTEGTAYQSFAAATTPQSPAPTPSPRVEQFENQKEIPVISQEKNNNGLLLTLSIILILASLGILGAFFFFLRNEPQASLPTQNKNLIINVESTKEIPIQETDNTLNALVVAQEGLTLNDRAIAHIQFTISTTTNDKKKTVVQIPMNVLMFVKNFQTPIPESLVRSFDSNYISGYFNELGTAKPLLVFKISQYEPAYVAMLEWENTIASDLQKLFPNTAVSGTTFTDILINNKNARVLISAEGMPILYYAFPNKQTLVISSSEEALREVFVRLTTAQFVE